MKKDLFGFETQGIKYDQHRPKYPLNFLTDPLKKLKHRRRYLDIATGTGQILFQIASNFQYSMGVDNSKKMIGICQSKVKGGSHRNIQFQECDFMKWENRGDKYDYITIGAALHWLPIRESLLKMKGMLNNQGMLNVYGYYLKGLRGSNGQEREDYNKLYHSVYTEKIRKYFDFDADSFHNHYTNEVDYPFREMFKIERHQLEVRPKMSKLGFQEYIKTFSSYNPYVEKTKDDPVKQIEEKVDEEQITCVVNYFMIQCTE